MGNKINIDVWKTKLNPNPNSPIISVISLFDLLFYEEKGFAAPIRCKECRDAKKARNLEREEVEKNKQKDSFEEMLKKFQASTVKIEK